MTTSKRNDAIVQCSVDRRYLAACVLYFEHVTQMRVRSKSELVRTAIEFCASAAIKELGEGVIKSTDDATAILDLVGVGSLNPAGRLQGGLSKNLINDDPERPSAVPRFDPEPECELEHDQVNMSTAKLRELVRQAAHEHLDAQIESPEQAQRRRANAARDMIEQFRKTRPDHGKDQ